MNENGSYIFHVELPTDWRLPGEPFWISGWFLSKTPLRYTDVRAWIDDVPFCGLFGLPRPEINAQYPRWAHRTGAGFSFLLKPWAGAKLIRLEICNEHGHWGEYWRVPISVGAKAGEKPKRVLHPDLLEPILFRLWKTPSFFPHVPVDEMIRRSVLEASIVPLDTLPVPPLHGALEERELVTPTQYHKLQVCGWVAHETLAVKRVFATTDGAHENEMVSGLERPDVAAGRSHLKNAATAGFESLVDIRPNAADPVLLKIIVELENGERVLAFAKRIHQVTSTEREHSYSPWDARTYRRLVWSLSRECKRQGVSLPPGFLRRVWAIAQKIRSRAHPPSPWFAWERQPALERLRTLNRGGSRLRAAWERDGAALASADGPQVGFVIDARGAARDELERSVAQLKAQAYPRWQAALVTEPKQSVDVAAAITQLVAGETRIALVRVEPSEPRVVALRTGLNAIAGAMVSFPEIGAEIAPQTALEVAEAASAKGPGQLDVRGEEPADLVYTDEDILHPDGGHTDAIFKGDWGPESALNGFHPGQLLFVRRRLLDESGALAPAAGNAWFRDLLLRVSERVPPSRVKHVAQLCYSVPVARRANSDLAAEQTALAASLARRGWDAEAEVASMGPRAWTRVGWRGTFLQENPVTIVIPTRDYFDLLVRCVEALDHTVDWRFVKLVIVDDGSRDPKKLRLLERLQKRTDLSCRVIQGPSPEKSFNYSRLVNTALPHIDTPLVLHLNNDVDAQHRGWLEAMAGWFAIPEVGAVGAKLVYPNSALNHTGLVVGPEGGLADTPLAHHNCDNFNFLEWHALARNVSAVTGACLLMRTADYRRLGGFEESELGVAYNDVDFCLRLLAEGKRVVYEPRAKLIHWGSATRGHAYYDTAEHHAFLRRWAGFRDGQFHPKIRLVKGGFEFEHAKFDHGHRATKPRLLLITHNLKFEGAPLFLLEYARYMAKEAGLKLRVLAAEDGPLRAAYEELGIPITLIDRHPLHGPRDDAEQNAAVQHALSQLDLSDVDVFICNTIACWWGVWLARAAGKASILYVHESATIKRFFAGGLHKHRHGVVHEALRAASRVNFLAHSTWAYYALWNSRDHYRLTPSWIDLERIEAFKRTHSRAELRAQHGIGPDDVVIANVGTVCERKGQHVFVRTIDHYRRYHGDPRKHHWLFVGGRPGRYQDSILRDLAQLGIPESDYRFIQETREIFAWFLIADVFVCSSFEESFPRVLLEAMAFEVPIVSTGVHGVPEMVLHPAEATLVPPGDEAAMAVALRGVLDRLKVGLSTAPLAYSKVTRLYDLKRVLPLHVELAREAMLAE